MYIFEINSLSTASFAISFSHSEGCLFTLLIVSFVGALFLRDGCLVVIRFSKGQSPEKNYTWCSRVSLLYSLLFNLILRAFLCKHAEQWTWKIGTTDRTEKTNVGGCVKEKLKYCCKIDG